MILALRAFVLCATAILAIAAGVASPISIQGEGATRARGLVVAEGGGSAGAPWAREVSERMVRHARTALELPDGTVVSVAILGGDGAAMARRFGEVEGTVVAVLDPIAREADLAALQGCHVVWIVGGDQHRYIESWNDTPVEELLVESWRKGAAIGGTSAGCAVLGEWVFDAAKGSIDERQALGDARHAELSLRNDFLPLVPGVLFDTHFTERGRLARLAVMATALIADEHDVLAIGVDDRTALLVTGDGRAEVVGEGAITVLRRGPDTRVESRAGRPPSASALLHDQLVAGHVFDLVERRVVARPADARTELPAAPTLRFDRRLDRVRGDAETSARLGDFELVHDGRDALIEGRLSTRPGEARLAGAIVVPRTFFDARLDEVHVGGGQFALANHPGRIVLHLDQSIDLEVESRNRLRVVAAGEDPPRSLMILDGRRLTSTAASTAPSRGDPSRTRQSVALEGARLWLVAPGSTFEP